MRQWIRWPLFAVALWAGAFGISVLVAEWRQETTDLRPLAEDIADLKTDVAEIKGRVGGVPPEEATPTPTAEEMVVRAEVGAVVEWRGMRLTIEDIRAEHVEPGTTQIWVTFVLENVDASAETARGLNFKATDAGGVLCPTASHFQALQLGEKARDRAFFPCDVKTLLVDGIRFEFP